MHRSGWTRSAALVGTLLAASLATLLACSGRTTGVEACDGSAGCGDGSGGSSGSSSGGFPFGGPSCSGPAYNVACWQCVHGACPGTESCLTTDCSGYFDCYCACAPGDTTCQASCQGALSMTCQTCAKNVSACEKLSCPAQCTSDGG